MRIGFYPGSFDPVTYGHLDIIARASRLVDKLVVGVGVHDGKNALLSEAERMSLIDRVARPLADHAHLKLEVISFTGLAVTAARKSNANMLIRGLRDASDFDYEVQMGQMNAALDTEIETVFLAASPGTRMLASSLVKQVAKLKGDVSAFVPAEVADALAAALKKTS